MKEYNISMFKTTMNNLIDIIVQRELHIQMVLVDLEQYVAPFAL